MNIPVIIVYFPVKFSDNPPISTTVGDQQNVRIKCLFLVIHLKPFIMTKTNVPKWMINFITTAFLFSVVGSIFPRIKYS